MRKLWLLSFILVSCTDEANFSIVPLDVEVADLPAEIESGNKVNIGLTYTFNNGCSSFYSVTLTEENKTVIIDTKAKRSHSTVCPLLIVTGSITINHAPRQTGTYTYLFNQGKLIKHIIVQ